jgi:hypothetical protein
MQGVLAPFTIKLILGPEIDNYPNFIKSLARSLPPLIKGKAYP